MDQNKIFIVEELYTVCRRCVLAALRTVRLGLTEVGNRAKPLKYSGKKKVILVFRTNLEQMFKLATTDRD